RHRVFIRVRQDGNQASFNVDWDDNKDYFTWDGNPKNLYYRENGLWDVTMLQHPWIGSHDNRLTFHKVRVRSLSGSVRRDVITQEDRDKDLKNGYVRLVGEEASAVKAGWAKFTVNQAPFAVSADEVWPMISHDFKVCDEFYGAHAPSRLKCNIPNGAKSFSVIGYNPASHSAKFVVLIDGEELYRSAETGLEIIRVDIPPKATLLELVADECGNNDYDQTHWCYPRYHAVGSDRVTEKMLDGKSGTLKFAVASGTAAGPVTHNKPIGGNRYIPVSFHDATLCEEFLFNHAPSTVTYQVPEGMSRFTAIGYCVWSSHVKYEVWADAKRIYESPQAGIVPIDVKLPAKTKTVELRVADLGDGRGDRALWCYPRLYRK
ncbi:MAG TPA: NPCBM/NEW2 domain-containing protein, partial [Schlesneria sp.]